MDEIEWHARFDERVIHPEDVIFGAVTRRRRRGCHLLRIQQRDARERLLVAQIPLVTMVPVVDALDHRQPAAIVQDAGELRDPGPRAVGGSFRDPQPDLRLALD